MKTDWWIEYTIKRSFDEGFAILVSGPCRAHKNSCEVKVQRTLDAWFNIEPWYKHDAKHLSKSIALAEGEAQYELFAKPKISSFPRAVVGVDGETHYLVLGAFQNISRFQWFMDLPDEWKEFELGVLQLSELAEVVLSSSA